MPPAPVATRTVARPEAPLDSAVQLMIGYDRSRLADDWTMRRQPRLLLAERYTAVADDWLADDTSIYGYISL